MSEPVRRQDPHRDGAAAEHGGEGRDFTPLVVYAASALASVLVARFLYLEARRALRRACCCR